MLLGDHQKAYMKSKTDSCIARHTRKSYLAPGLPYLCHCTVLKPMSDVHACRSQAACPTHKLKPGDRLEDAAA